MDHLKEVRIGYNAELQHMFRILARKERSFYAMTSEDDAKDDLRRQLRLLHSIVESLWLELGAIDYHIVSSTRLRDILAKEYEVRSDPRLDSYAPHKSTWEVRQYWNLVTQLYGAFSEAKRANNPALNKLLERAGVDPKRVGNEVERVRRDVEAADRLLKELELRIQKFESGDHEAFERLLKELDAPPQKDESVDTGK
jgi:hypothetical protein